MTESLAPGTAAVADSILAGIAMISADAIVCVDESQKIIFYNEGAEGIFGWSVSEIIGKPLETLLPDRFRASHAGHVRKFGNSAVRARRMGERGTIVGLRRNGEEFPAEAAISHLQADGTTIFSVVLRDVTERKRSLQTQELLAEAGEVLASSLGPEDTLRNVTRLAVPRLADACVVNSYRGGLFQGIAVAHVNSERGNELRKRRIEHPIDPDGAHPVSQVIRSGRTIVWSETEGSDETREAVERELQDVFGKPPAAGIVTPLVARGNLLGVLSFYRESGTYDPVDVFLAEELARRAALAIDNAHLYDQVHAGIRARDDMIGIVSHDLRNPVNAIKMLTRVMLDRDRGDIVIGEMVDYASVIRQAAEQMDSLIRDLLDVTRVEAGRLAVSAHRENTEELLSDALRTLAPVAGEKSITLRLTAPDDLPDVIADRERIAQALSNLIGNAVKFSPPDGEIIVHVAVLESEIVISVTDSGRGMTPDQLTHAFDRFWQSSRTDRQGAGLGLAITKGIIEAHGGRIWVVSTPGSGSTFYFTLSIAS
jgi:PAS domain S-box-containing protein